MPTAQKEKNIDQTREWFEKATGVVFSDYRGLSVKEMQTLRSDLRKKGGEIHVVKNTLFRRAAGDVASVVPEEFHNGTTAYTFIFEGESDVTKALLDFARTSKKLAVKGGYFGGKAYDAKGVEALSTLPPKPVLISQIIGLIASPLVDLAGVIEALYADPIRVIGAVADKLNEGGSADSSAESAPVAA